MAKSADSFDEFYAARMPRLTHTLFLAFGDIAQAEDSAQEAFVRAWQRWDSLDTADPIGWVRTVAWRLCVDDWRSSFRARKAIRIMRSNVEYSPPAPTAALDLLSGLSEALRTVAALHYVEDMSVDDISQLLGIPPGTVKSRLSRARQALREQYVASERTRDG